MAAVPSSRSLAGAARTLAAGLLHLLYPGVCSGCAVALPPGETPFCARCRSLLTHDPHLRCPRCGGSIGPYANVAGGCSVCRGLGLHFDRVVCLRPYDGLLRELILRMKQPTGEELAELLGAFWAEQSGPQLRGLGSSVVLPVPLHWLRRWQRGYNQSETLARVLAASLKLPCRTRWLRRVRYTPFLSQQSPQARPATVRGAFAVRRSSVLQGQVVLLVDDVLTTGATASEAARVLRKAGAAGVVVAVLARAQH